MKEGQDEMLQRLVTVKKIEKNFYMFFQTEIPPLSDYGILTFSHHDDPTSGQYSDFILMSYWKVDVLLNMKEP